MGKKKAKFDLAAERATAILQEHFDSLPSELAKQKRAEFHQLTIEMSRGSPEKLHEFGELPRLVGNTNLPQSLHKFTFSAGTKALRTSVSSFLSNFSALLFCRGTHCSSSRALLISSPSYMCFALQDSPRAFC